MTDYTATGSFYVSGGQIVDPKGSAFVARGIDVMEGNEPSVGTLQSDFPGINFVRYAIYDYADPSALESYVNSLTSQGIAVELEDHTNSTGGNAGGGQGTIYSGSQLSNELDWYSSIASAFKDNSYVWFGTDNEPSETDASGNNDPAALSQWQQETYDTIRDTGNTNPVLLEVTPWGANETNVGYVGSDYADMTNVVWDVHYYGWLSGYSTDQNTVSNTLSSVIAGAQEITSADGTIPVIIGEYGNSTDGLSIDPNESEVITAVQDSGYGSAAWAYADATSDGLLAAGNALSSFGQAVAAFIAAGASDSTAPASASTGTSASANDSVVLAGSTASLTDSSGNTWTAGSDGIVYENGTTPGYTAYVTDIAYADGTIWAQNTSGLWWNWDGSNWDGGTSTSPLAESASDTVLTSSSASAIVDTNGNSWTITSNGTVDEDGGAAGYSANVVELAYVSGTVWQENSDDLWWSWTGNGWSSEDSSTSPLSST